MQITIIQKTEPINIFGQYEPVELLNSGTRQVFLDGTKVPDALAKIILLGLDVATEQYCELVEECMKMEQIKL